MAENVGFELPQPRRGSRQAKLVKEEGVDPVAIHKAVTYLEEAEAGARALTEEVKKFADSAKALLEGGLTLNAVALLVQDKCPKQSGGSSHGKPKYSTQVITDVLQAAARCGEHVKK